MKFNRKKFINETMGNLDEVMDYIDILFTILKDNINDKNKIDIILKNITFKEYID